nr:unnamed protein product [Digitaria exilis]
MAPRASVLLLAVAVAAAASAAASSAQTSRLGRIVVSGVVPCNTGTFIDMEADAVTSTLGVLLGGCDLVVDTPLAKCNATLPAAGALVSSLQGPLGGMLGGVFRLAPAGFSFRMN